MRSLVLVVHNVRSCHNVGSLLRSADGLGVTCVYLCGYTPYPLAKNDARLPHLAAKVDRQIIKTALGAEKSVDWQHFENLSEVLDKLKADSFQVVALEQDERAINLNNYKPAQKVALVVGPEVSGFNKKELDLVDKIIQIPMKGTKESFNVAVAAAIALYHLSVNS